MPRILAAGVVAVTTAVLLAIAIGPHTVGDYLAETDFYGAYADGAKGIQQGHFDPARYTVVGPVYELVLAGVSAIVRDPFFAAELISVLSAAATMILWFVLLARRIGGWVGLWAVLLLAVNSTFIRYGYSASTDLLAIALQAGAWFALLAMRGRHAPLWAGLLTGLAVLTRYNALYLIPAAIATYAWLGKVGSEAAEATPGRWRAIARYAGAAAILLVPWWALTASTGRPLGGELYHNIAYDVYAKARGLTWDQYQTELQPQFQGLGDVLARDPEAVVKRELQNVLTHARNDLRDLLGWGMAAACVVGAALGFRSSHRRDLLSLAIGGALLFLTLVPVQHSERYSLALLPIYLAFSGVALGSPQFAFLLRKPLVPLKWLAGLALVIAAAIPCVRDLRYHMTQLPVEVLPASEALRRAAPPGARVMARKPHIAYYARLGFVPFPNAGTLEDIAAECRAQGAKYLYFSWPEADLRPQFAYLLDTSAPIPGLAVVAEIERNPAVVYAVNEGFGTAPAWLTDDRARQVHAARAEVKIHEDEAWEAHLTLGVEAGRQGRYAEALDHLERVTRQRPEHVRAWILLGETRLRLDQPDRAREAFATAIERDPKSVDARLGLGWVEWHGGRFEQAAEIWRPVVRETAHIPTLEEMVRVYSRIGDRAAVEAAEATLAARRSSGSSGATP